MLSFIHLRILPTIFLPTDTYIGPHYATLVPQPLWNLTVQIPPHQYIPIWHSMVITAIRVAKAETVTNGVLPQVQPDLSTGAQWAMSIDTT